MLKKKSRGTGTWTGALTRSEERADPGEPAWSAGQRPGPCPDFRTAHSGTAHLHLQAGRGRARGGARWSGARQSEPHQGTARCGCHGAVVGGRWGGGRRGWGQWRVPASLLIAITPGVLLGCTVGASAHYRGCQLCATSAVEQLPRGTIPLEIGRDILSI